LHSLVGGRLDDGAVRGTYLKLFTAVGAAAAVGRTVARACGAALGEDTWPVALATGAGTLALTTAYPPPRPAAEGARATESARAAVRRRAGTREVKRTFSNRHNTGLNSV
jgi:hypothetical protein